MRYLSRAKPSQAKLRSQQTLWHFCSFSVYLYLYLYLFWCFCRHLGELNAQANWPGLSPKALSPNLIHAGVLRFPPVAMDLGSLEHLHLSTPVLSVLHSLPRPDPPAVRACHPHHRGCFCRKGDVRAAYAEGGDTTTRRGAFWRAGPLLLRMDHGNKEGGERQEGEREVAVQLLARIRQLAGGGRDSD